MGTPDFDICRSAKTCPSVHPRGRVFVHGQRWVGTIPNRGENRFLRFMDPLPTKTKPAGLRMRPTLGWVHSRASPDAVHVIYGPAPYENQTCLALLNVRQRD